MIGQTLELIMTIDQLYSQYGIGAGAVTVVVIVLMWAVYSNIRSLREKASLHEATYLATRDYYSLAEEILKDPATPKQVKGVLTDLLLITTYDEMGKIAYDCLLELISENGNQLPQTTNSLKLSLDQLKCHRSDLYDSIFDAFRAAFTAIISGHCHSDGRVSITIRKTTNESSKLVALAEKLDSVLAKKKNNHPHDDNQNHNGGHCPIPASSG
jgi:hypothetical protein